jgi:hypothetical protein
LVILMTSTTSMSFFDIADALSIVWILKQTIPIVRCAFMRCCVPAKDQPGKENCPRPWEPLMIPGVPGSDDDPQELFEGEILSSPSTADAKLGKTKRLMDWQRYELR